MSWKELCHLPVNEQIVRLTARTGACRTSRVAFASARNVRTSRSGLRCRAGGDATGFLDLANLVSGGGGSKTAYDGLASKIGACAGPPLERCCIRCDGSLVGKLVLCLSAWVSQSGPGLERAVPATGKEVYVDVNGWHLYLRDISVPGADGKLSQALAAHLGSKVGGKPGWAHWSKTTWATAQAC